MNQGVEDLRVTEDRYATSYESTVQPRSRGRFQMKPAALVALLAVLLGFYLITALRGDRPEAPPTIGPSAQTAPLAAGEVKGFFTAIDGDTVELDGVRYRLWGIDAPDPGQEAGEYADQATMALIQATSYPWICKDLGDRSRTRIVAECRFANGSGDVSEWMVRAGFAVDWPEFSRGRYSDVESAARAERRGIWQTHDGSWR